MVLPTDCSFLIWKLNKLTPNKRLLNLHFKTEYAMPYSLTWSTCIEIALLPKEKLYKGKMKNAWQNTSY